MKAVIPVHIVIAGLDPAIHFSGLNVHLMDARVRLAHDD
jgi:hypothetical protein